MKFIDLARIHVKAGDGGVGCVSFRREKYVPRGGPDGGNGGRGGDVLVRANKQLNTLLDFHYKRIYAARRGEHGLGSNKTGKSGPSILLEVPAGSIIRDVETNEVIGDLVHDGEELVVATGGKGGRGNAAFATATDQAPRNYERGAAGEEREIELELKLLADVGLVGFPNAGKSTLISVISSARPKIADYPFTTLVPNLGIARVDEGKSFVVADIPGLIEGAHLGRGLGLQFLRHIERTRVLVFLIEATSEDLQADYAVLLRELKSFKKDLLLKPRIVAITKSDLVNAQSIRRLRTLRFQAASSFILSAVTRSGITPLVRAMWSALASNRTHGQHGNPRPSRRAQAQTASK